jgi:hypothetical protein
MRNLPRAALRPGLALFFLLFIANLFQPAPLLITAGPRQQVVTEHPRLGVHTRLTDEVEEWKIKQTLQMVREMGAPWIVEFFPWAYYHGEDGSIDWSHPDMVVEHAHAQGLQIIARIGFTPGWARPPDTSLRYLDADGYDGFATFAAAFAERYRARVCCLIVGNEPNLSFEWDYRQATAEDYVALLRTVYPAVKAANPEMVVLAGALAPTLEPPGSPWAINDLIYLENMYQAGAAAYFDGLAVHVYGLTEAPEAEPGTEQLNFRRVELMREVMVRHGDAATQIYITETGWNDHPRWTHAVSPAQRIHYTLAAIRYVEEHWPFVEMMAVWAFRFPAPTRSYADYFTLVTPEFVPKPLYDELRAFTGNQPPRPREASE